MLLFPGLWKRVNDCSLINFFMPFTMLCNSTACIPFCLFCRLKSPSLLSLSSYENCSMSLIIPVIFVLHRVYLCEIVWLEQQEALRMWIYHEFIQQHNQILWVFCILLLIILYIVSFSLPLPWIWFFFFCIAANNNVGSLYWVESDNFPHSLSVTVVFLTMYIVQSIEIISFAVLLHSHSYHKTLCNYLQLILIF